MLKIKYVLKKIKRIKKINNDIGNMKTVRELFLYISYGFLNKLVFFVLMIWVISPLIVLFWSMAYEDRGVGFYGYLWQRGVFWTGLLWTVGFLCILFGVFYLIKMVYEKEIHSIFRGNMVVFFLTLFFLWSVVINFFVVNPYTYMGTLYRREGMFSYIAYFGVFVGGYLLKDTRFKLKLIRMFVYVSTFLCILDFLDVEALNTLLDIEKGKSVFFNINHFGYYLVLSILSAYVLFVYQSFNFKKIVYLFSYVIMLISLIDNKSFGSYLAIVVILFVSAIYFFIRDKEKVKSMVVAFLTFLCISLYFNYLDAHISNDILRVSDDIKRIAEKKEDVGSAGSGRWKLWVYAIELISKKPFTGFGLDNLGSEYAKANIKLDRPHNEFMQFALTSGIPALVFYILSIFMLVKDKVGIILKRIIPKRKVNPIFFVFLGYMISSMFGNTMYYTSPFFFMIFALACGRLD